MADCAAAAAPLSSPAPSAHRCAAAGLDSGTPAELLASMPFDGAVDRLEWARPRSGSDSGTPAELLASMPFDGAVDRLEWARPRSGSAGDRWRRAQPVRS